jgi:hypothetical protein
MAGSGSTVPRTAPGDADTPPVITPGATPRATTPADTILDTLHAALAAHTRRPQAPRVDNGDTAAAMLVGSDQASGVTLVGPVAADPRGPAREATGLEKRAVTLAWATHTASCPPGNQRRKWQADTEVAGQEVSHLRCANKDGQACAGRSAWTRAHTEPRTLTVRTPGDHDVLQAARPRQKTVEVQEP